MKKQFTGQNSKSISMPGSKRGSVDDQMRHSKANWSIDNFGTISGSSSIVQNQQTTPYMMAPSRGQMKQAQQSAP
jgi:hypothetical protein